MPQVNSGNPDLDALLRQLADLHRAKNHDYSSPETGDFYANFREAESLGVPAWRGILIRMSDRWSRLRNLSTKPAAVAGRNANIYSGGVRRLLLIVLMGALQTMPPLRAHYELVFVH